MVKTNFIARTLLNNEFIVINTNIFYFIQEILWVGFFIVSMVLQIFRKFNMLTVYQSSQFITQDTHYLFPHYVLKSIFINWNLRIAAM